MIAPPGAGFLDQPDMPLSARGKLGDMAGPWNANIHYDGRLDARVPASASTADHAIPLALQLAMANTAHADITEVDASHLSMISDPGAVTNVILQAVRATS